MAETQTDFDPGGAPALPAGFDYCAGWLAPAMADTLFDVLWEQVPWRQDKISMFGRQIPQPRLSSWCADTGVHYTYSGLRLEPAAVHPVESWDFIDFFSRHKIQTSQTLE